MTSRNTQIRNQKTRTAKRIDLGYWSRTRRDKKTLPSRYPLSFLFLVKARYDLLSISFTRNNGDSCGIGLFSSSRSRGESLETRRTTHNDRYSEYREVKHIWIWLYNSWKHSPIFFGNCIRSRNVKSRKDLKQETYRYRANHRLHQLYQSSQWEYDQRSTV